MLGPALHWGGARESWASVLVFSLGLLLLLLLLLFVFFPLLFVTQALNELVCEKADRGNGHENQDRVQNHAAYTGRPPEWK